MFIINEIICYSLFKIKSKQVLLAKLKKFKFNKNETLFRIVIQLL